jgi:hypothetical protein
LNDTLAELKKEFTDTFNPAYIDAEEVSEASMQANVEAAPTVVFYRV